MNIFFFLVSYISLYVHCEMFILRFIYKLYNFTGDQQIPLKQTVAFNCIVKWEIPLKIGPPFSNSTKMKLKDWKLPNPPHATGTYLQLSAACRPHVQKVTALAKAYLMRVDYGWAPIHHEFRMCYSRLVLPCIFLRGQTHPAVIVGNVLCDLHKLIISQQKHM